MSQSYHEGMLSKKILFIIQVVIFSNLMLETSTLAWIKQLQYLFLSETIAFQCIVK